MPIKEFYFIYLFVERPKKKPMRRRNAMRALNQLFFMRPHDADGFDSAPHHMHQGWITALVIWYGAIEIAIQFRSAREAENLWGQYISAKYSKFLHSGSIYRSPSCARTLSFYIAITPRFIMFFLEQKLLLLHESTRWLDWRLFRACFH